MEPFLWLSYIAFFGRKTVVRFKKTLAYRFTSRLCLGGRPVVLKEIESCFRSLPIDPLSLSLPLLQVGILIDQWAYKGPDWQLLFELFDSEKDPSGGDCLTIFHKDREICQVIFMHERVVEIREWRRRRQVLYPILNPEEVFQLFRMRAIMIGAVEVFLDRIA